MSAEEAPVAAPAEAQAVAPAEKIIDKINRCVAEGKTPFYSFEYFPPRTEDGVKNLYDRLDRMALLNPLFMDFTWGAVSAPPMRAARWC